jgi:hypothetical protein
MEKERDEAREALAKLSLGTGAGTQAKDKKMDVDSTGGVPAAIVEKINKYKEEYLPTTKTISNV